MTQSENLFLKIFSSSVFENHEADFSDFDDFCQWNELFALCRKHSAVGITYQAVQNIFKSKIPDDISAQWKKETLMSGAVQSARSQALYSVCKKLNKKGLKPLVLKGEVLRTLYKNPEARTSVDEDLLIEKSQYSKLCEALTELGFEETLKGGDDVHWVNKKLSLYFEIHFSPFPENKNYSSWNACFEDCFSRSVSMENGIFALSPTDELIFLFLHSAKHFIYSGVGVKQLSDIALLTNKYQSEIDFSLVEAQLKKCGAFDFAKGISAFINAYLCPFTFFEENPLCNEALAQDIIDGGSLGAGSSERQHSAAITSGAFKKESVFKKIFFPPKERLKAKYPFARKYSVLLPLAWVMRIFSYLKKDKKGKAFSAGKQRLELIKKYNFIK